MQVLGKRSKVLLIAIAMAMLVVLGVSFALWDTSAVKAISGDINQYANAKVGDVITFGNYYQTGNRINNDENAEYEKTPIEWLVVDKDERTGQLTLMSKYILAAGSFFGNYYKNEADVWGFHYQTGNVQTAGNPYNQAYVESTARAFLNNLERRDLGGDSYISEEFKTSATASDAEKGKLLTSVGFSNRKYYINSTSYQRPIDNPEFKNRPATRGFYDEAFSDNEKSMIVPRVIAEYTGFRWPANTHEPSEKTYVEGGVDKVWLPSTTELNIMAVEDNYTNPNDEASSTVLEYFKNYAQYINPVSNINNTTLANSLKTVRTNFVKNNSKAMNYSIPVYQYQSTAINENIHITSNSLDHYWTRSSVSNYSSSVRTVNSSGSFTGTNTNDSTLGVRPCLILKY